MSNLVFSAAAAGLISVAILGQQVMRDRTERENAKLASVIRGIEQELQAIEELLAAGRGELEQNRTTAGTLRAELHAEPAASVPPPIDPEHEALWPSNKPYFYLSKSLLPTASFQRFGPGVLRLNPNTVAVLGMTPAEAVAVDEGFQDLVDRFRKLEAERLTLVSVEAVAKSKTEWPGKKTTYRLPALREEMETVIENYFAAVHAVLGQQRAAVYEPWVESCIKESLWGFGPRPRIITLKDEDLPDSRRLTRFDMVEEGGKWLYGYELWNPPRHEDYGLPAGEFAPRFPYWHLFGDNGQLRPGVAPSR